MSRINIGITKAFPCSYLSDQKEQLMMLSEPEKSAASLYPILLENGFRRSGDQVYRPHCPSCQECQSLRISVTQFQLSRSQKRLLNKNKIFTTRISNTPKPQYYDLYQKYINIIHYNGVMFPASLKQYDTFIKSSWNQPVFLEIYDQDKLISVSVTDQILGDKDKAWSAFYCFYDPDYQKYSLGKYAVLCQLKLAKKYSIDWLYLGYYIEKCKKMNYKVQYNPHQRFIGGKWVSFHL